MEAKSAKQSKFEEFCNQQIRDCLDAMRYDLAYELPIPTAPATPLLYVPKGVTALTDGSSNRVLALDIEASASGVVDDLPLTYYPIDPESLRQCRNAVEANSKRLEDQARAAIAKGLPPREVLSAQDRNPNLSDADLKIITNADIEANPLDHIALPSLRLLKAPLYTELGAVSPDARAQARLERQIREVRNYLLQHQSGGNAAASVDQARAKAAEIAGSEAGGDRLLEAAQQQNAFGSLTTIAPPDSKQAWTLDVVKSFKNSRSLSEQFDEYRRAIGRKVFALDNSAKAAGEASSDDTQLADEEIQHLVGRLLRLAALLRSEGAKQGFWDSVQCAIATYVSTGSAADAAQDSLEYLKTKAAIPRHIALSLQQWLVSYAAQLERRGNLDLILPDVVNSRSTSEPFDMLKWWTHFSSLRIPLMKSDDAKVVSLQHPTNKNAVPLACLPVVGPHDPAAAGSTLGVEPKLACRVFHGQRPLDYSSPNVDAPKAICNSAILLNNVLLRAPEQQNDSSEAEAVDAAVEYTASETRFASFKQDLNHTGRVVLALRDRDVVFTRIGELREYHRDVSDAVRSGNTALSFGRQRHVVMWEDDDTNAAGSSSSQVGVKRPRS